MTELTGKERRSLRALGHHLKPIVQVGHAGVTDGVLDALRAALTQHELVKVKVLESSPLDRFETSEAIGTPLGAAIAQVLGRTLLFYKPNPKGRRIDLKKGIWLAPEKKLAPEVDGEDGKATPAKRNAVPRGAKKAAPKKRPPARPGSGARLPPRRHRPS